MKNIILITFLLFTFSSFSQDEEIDLIYQNVENALSEIKESSKPIQEAIDQVFKDGGVDKWKILSSNSYNALVKKYPKMVYAFRELEDENEYHFEEYVAPDYTYEINKYVLRELFNISVDAKTIQAGPTLRAQLDMEKEVYRKLAKGKTLSSLKYSLKKMPIRIYNLGKVVGINLVTGVFFPGVGLFAGGLLGGIAYPWFGLPGIKVLLSVGGGAGALLALSYMWYTTSTEISNEIAGMRNRSVEYLNGKLKDYKLNKTHKSSLTKMLELADKYQLKIESSDKSIKIISKNNFVMNIRVESNGKATNLGNTSLVYSVELAQKSYSHLEKTINIIRDEMMSILSYNRCSMNYIK